ncbi:MAG: DUF1874 domain-containing protein, partial [Desulfurococcales archaeon]|nr:DUF1874 domain-containing protein [Desulfurococcales archaeon]
ADIAAIISKQLNIAITPNRITIALQPGDKAIIAQYTGPRLPEGTTTLPDNATIEYFLINIINV